LTDPFPTHDSCTISSIVSPAWRLSDFETVTISNGTLGSLRFGIEFAPVGSQATDFPSIVFNKGVDFTSGRTASNITWTKCQFESIGDVALAPTGCQFRYNGETKVFALKVEWQCDDLDAKNP
jgi:hypothetical protein